MNLAEVQLMPHSHPQDRRTFGSGGGQLHTGLWRFHRDLSRCAGGLLLGLAALTHPIAAQSSDVVGRVLDQRTRQPVVDAVVVLAGTAHQTVTDAQGMFRLADVRNGRYTLRVSHIAYGEGMVPVTVVAGRPT
ncbi:MAG: carboxypeptidase regulatory-like domain-containing protein, partial [Planctomycetaceae bacterium]